MEQDDFAETLTSRTKKSEEVCGKNDPFNFLQKQANCDPMTSKPHPKSVRESLVEE